MVIALPLLLFGIQMSVACNFEQSEDDLAVCHLWMFGQEITERLKHV